jgi:hypothetical protein
MTPGTIGSPCPAPAAVPSPAPGTRLTPKAALRPDSLAVDHLIPGTQPQGNPDLRKITRNLSLTFAAFRDTGQQLSRPIHDDDGRVRWTALRQVDLDTRAVYRPTLDGGFRAPLTRYRRPGKRAAGPSHLTSELRLKEADRAFQPFYPQPSLCALFCQGSRQVRDSGPGRDRVRVVGAEHALHVRQQIPVQAQ